MVFNIFSDILIILLRILRETKNYTLQWRHNERDGVSNHQLHDCLLNLLFRRRSKETSKLRITGLCAGDSLVTVNSPHQRPVTQQMFPFDDVMMIVVQVYSVKTWWNMSNVVYHPVAIVPVSMRFQYLCFQQSLHNFRSTCYNRPNMPGICFKRGIRSFSLGHVYLILRVIPHRLVS